MSVSGSVARRYARALLALGKEGNKTRGLLAEVERVATAVEDSSELRDVLRSPVVLPSQRKQVLEAVVQKLGVSRQVRNTCMLLAERGRADILPAVARELRDMVDEHEGVVRAEVVSASPLDRSYLDQLTGKLQRITGKKIELTTKENPSLVAGVVTRVGGVVYDGSLRARMSRVREQMLR
jgi:F-type H+-transporting ATPase subunit delta